MYLSFLLKNTINGIKLVEYNYMIYFGSEGTVV